MKPTKLPGMASFPSRAACFGGLTQSELPEIGSQSVVSEILSGRRALNVRQVRALAWRFGVSADAFL